MKLTAILLAMVSLVWAKNPWKLGGRVGVQQSNGALVPTAAFTAEYTLLDRVSWRTDFEAQFRDLAHTDQFALQVPTHLLLHPLGTRLNFDPYAGPGASVGLDFERKVMLGLNGVFGFTVRPKAQQAFGLEARWSWPDMTRTLGGRWDAALTGNWEMKF